MKEEIDGVELVLIHNSLISHYILKETCCDTQVISVVIH
jgi:hypothetical protein